MTGLLSSPKDVSSSSFIVAMAHAEYKKPIRDKYQVTVTCWVSRIGDRSWDLDYTVGSGRVVFAIGRTTQVAYNYMSQTTASVSEKIRKSLMKCAGKPLVFRTAP